VSKFKKIFITIAAVFAILSLCAMFLPYFIDLNRYKPRIQSLVSDKINAKLDFSRASLNIFGGIGLNLHDVELTNTQKPFEGQKVFVAKKVDIRFEFIPLFSKKLIGTVYLDKPTVNIITIGSENNLESLEKPEKRTEDPSHKGITENRGDSKKNAKSGFKVILNEFSVNDAHIIYKDLTNPANPTIIDMKNIDIDMIRENDIFNIERINLILFSGQLTSHIKIDTSNPQTTYKGGCELKKFSLSDLYHSFSSKEKTSPIQGKANIDFTFNGRGTTKPIYSKELNAKGNFSIDQGDFTLEATMPIILDQLGKFLSGITLPNFKLGITEEDVDKAADSDNQIISLDGIKGKFEIKKGVLFLNNNVPMKQGVLDLDVAIGIFTSNLKGVANFEASEEYTKHLLASNKNFAYLLNDRDRFYLKIFLSGTVENPIITVDTQDVMKNILLKTTESILDPRNTIETIKDTIQKVLPF